MKKALSLLCFALISLVSMQANAELWLIGDLSSHDWSYSQGDKFTAVDANNYTLDVNVTSAGDKYFSMTTKLGSSWADIVSSRFGGDGITVPLNTETTLTAGTDKSPKVSITSAGTYTITFNTSTKKVKISLKQEGEKFNGTIYVTKDSKGYVYAWDAAGNYGEWPGTAISSLSTATVNGTEYYKFTYSHNSTGPGLIFNEGKGLAQTGDLVPEDGRIYKYVGGTDTATTVTPDLYLFGPAAKGWDPTKGDKMTYDEAKNTYSIAITPDDATSFSFTTKLATTANDWNAIAAYRYGADTDGNDFVFSDTYLDKPLTLIKTDASGHAFAVPAGSYTITVSLDSMKVTISGAITPEPVDTAKVYILGNVVGDWDPTKGQEMATTDGSVYTADFKAIDNGDGYSYFAFTTKLGTWDQIASSRFGAVAENDFLVTQEWIGKSLSLTKDNYKSFKIPAGDYKLTVNLDSMKLVITGDIPVDTAKVYILGNDTVWSPNKGQQMVTTDGKVYTAKLKAIDNGGYSYFSFTTKLDSTWEAIADARFGAVSEGDFVVTAEYAGKKLSLTKDNYQAFKIPTGEYDLTLNLDSMYLVIDGDIVMPVDTADVFILGEVNGNKWAANKGVKMTYKDGNYTAKVTTAGENEGFSYFSFSKELADSANNWDAIAAARFGAVSEGNFLVTDSLVGKKLSLEMGGDAYQIPAGEFNLTLNLDSMYLVIDGDIVMPVDTADVFILGEVNGNKWAANKGAKMTFADGKYTLKVTTEGENDGYSYFSFTTELAEGNEQADWEVIADKRFGAVSEGDFLVTPELIGKNISLVKGGESLKIPAGEYDLTLNLDSMTLVIEGEIVVPVDTAKVYILGNVVGNWNPAVGQQMATTDGKVYTAKLNAVDAGEGYSYFSFTTKLDSIWDNIADARFGAVSEGDFLVTPELIGEELSLEKGGDSFKIPTGNYNLTLDLEKMKLVIVEADDILLGDANGDGEVNSLDVTTIVNWILGNEVNKFVFDNADINGDEDINSADVTAVVNIILNN